MQSRKSFGARHARRPRQAGFTLVEMAVVLVIIGIILGAVMIGRDAQRNAEYTRIRQNFVAQWVVAYNSYVQRYGVPPGDNARAPRLMVNGTNYSGAMGGDLSSVTEPDAVCAGEAGPGMSRDAQSSTSLRTLMLQAGIQLPQGRGEGMEDRYVYLDTNGNPQEIQVCFQWNRPGTASGPGNVMVLTGLTPDLARALSVAIDGNTSANSGSFRLQGVSQGAQADADDSLDWGAFNTQNYGSAGGGGGDDGGTAPAADSAEGQVITVVAHYKMNQ